MALVDQPPPGPHPASRREPVLAYLQPAFEAESQLRPHDQERAAKYWPWRGPLFQHEPVDLSDEVDAETLVWLLSLQDKTSRQVDPPGGDERVVGP